jgi:alkylation response protein AidB-like acyl-CoA dehydrogenase
MADYRAPVKDTIFAMRHLGEVESIVKASRYEHVDIETMETAVHEMGRFMTEVFAPTNRIGDTVGLEWTPDGVVTPPEFKPAYDKFVEAGWQGMNLSPDYGGAGFPEIMAVIGVEYACGANGALSMAPGLTTGACECLQEWASEELRERFLPKMVAGEWTGTMNLTEPQAGSDLGLLTTKAVPTDDGAFLITGTKIFISFGSHDLTDNVIHLVLARTPDAPPGTKGISLFLVPDVMVNDDGSLGEPNDVRCVSIEEKLGIHASPTCVMSFGDDGGSVGYLIGEENHGLRAMFTMMNSARIAVAAQGLGFADAAYQKAHDYATERKQGKEIGGDGHGPVEIIRHPDVRRMLMHMRSRLEAVRGLIYYTSTAIDRARSFDGDEGERWQEIADILTPIAKSWATDSSVEITSMAVQVFGGIGFIEEAGVAQHYRDARILPIYEGTNGIQAMDLVGRKLPMRMGGAVEDFIAMMRSDAAALTADEVSGIRKNLEEGLDVLEEATTWVMQNGLADPREALAGATAYLELFAIVSGGWILAKQATAALGELAAGSTDVEFLEGKILTARFFAEQSLTKASGFMGPITAGSAILFEISDSALASS